MDLGPTRRLTCCQGVRHENSATRFRGPVALVKKCLKGGLLDDKEASILEIGAGCLRNLRFLQSEGFRNLTAVEINKTVERFPREYSLFLKRGGRFLPTIPRRERFDHILVTFVLETICPAESRLNLIRDFSMSLKRNGTLLISVRGPKDIRATNLVRCRHEVYGFATTKHTFIRRYTVNEIIQLLTRLGLPNVSSSNRVQEPRIIQIIARKS